MQPMNDARDALVLGEQREIGSSATLNGESERLVDELLMEMACQSEIDCSESRYKIYQQFCREKEIPLFPIRGSIIFLHIQQLALTLPDDSEDEHVNFFELVRENCLPLWQDAVGCEEAALPLREHPALQHLLLELAEKKPKTTRARNEVTTSTISIDDKANSTKAEVTPEVDKSVSRDSAASSESGESAQEKFDKKRKRNSAEIERNRAEFEPSEQTQSNKKVKRLPVLVPEIPFLSGVVNNVVNVPETASPTSPSSPQITRRVTVKSVKIGFLPPHQTMDTTPTGEGIFGKITRWFGR